MATRLTREEVLHIAALCRIGMSEEDVDRFQDQLSNILEQFEVLKRLDTTSVPPTSHPVEIHSVFREDAPGPSLAVEEVLRNAPGREGEFLKIKAVLEDT